LPHGAVAIRSPIAPVIIVGWIMVTGITVISLRFTADDTKVIIETAYVLVQSVLIGFSVLTVIESCLESRPVQKVMTPGEFLLAIINNYPFVMLVGTPGEIMQLHQHPQLDQCLEETPYPGTRIAPAAALDVVLEVCPDIRYLPWSEEFQGLFVMPHADVLQSRDAKVSEAMEAEANMQIAQEENSDLKQRLQAALAANRTLDAALHDLRRRGTTQMLDYSKMTPSQRIEETKRLEESLRRVAAATASPDISEAIRVPSDGFQSEIRLGSTES